MRLDSASESEISSPLAVFGMCVGRFCKVDEGFAWDARLGCEFVGCMVQPSCVLVGLRGRSLGVLAVDAGRCNLLISDAAVFDGWSLGHICGDVFADSVRSATRVEDGEVVRTVQTGDVSKFAVALPVTGL